MSNLATQSRKNVKIWGYPFLITVLAIVCLSLAKDFILPIILAFLLSLILSPAVRFLMRLKIPSVLASFTMLLVSCAVLVGAIWLVTPGVAKWMSAAPEKIEQRLSTDEEIQQTIDKLQETSKKVNDAVKKIGIEEESEQQTQVVIQQESWSSGLLASLQKGLSQTLLIFALTLFLLISGNELVLNLVRLSSQPKKRKRYIMLFQRLRREVGQYLGAAFLVNLTLGCLTSLVFWYLDVPLAWTWLVLVTFLRFVPYVGIGLIAILLVLVSMTHFDTLLETFMPLGIFMGLSTIFGFIVDPLVHSMRLRINPIIVFVSVIFWGWLWGAAGAILAVPLLTVALVTAECMGWTTLTRIVTRTN
ncbi:AI-2E family transporter [Catenovulum sp. 2E275]|uniref:AI-2E family transporter n=1 Tax=Catenovulum sp. 2E275 TaxID=2980497 RepID=UPI0021D12DFA|nr:AI-2E family transporter [Catenovulum sp. 2E275]MCU4676126.1 AI-2E family transporter [Catenovulum sp. 2E275]